MCEVENNIKFSWLLVSQFVSWDFCRYMCEQSDTWEPDVLTFLRNMVVERTEKAASDITKHEMVARFVMEARTIRTVERMPFIRELSKKVEEKCPELKSIIAELLFDLESLLLSLGRCTNPRKQEEMLKNMAQEVNKFNVEACKSLPLPNLLQVIQTWLQAEYQANQLKADIKKNIENEELFQRVVDCLHEEKITSEEAKVIARSLYEDKLLKKIILLNNSETETDIDSQSQSQSLQPYQVPPKLTPPQSLHVSSHYKLPSPVQQIEPENTTRSFTFNPAPLSSSPDHQESSNLSLHNSFNPSSPEEPLEDFQQYKVQDDFQDFGVLNPTKSYLFKLSTEPQIATRSTNSKALVQDSDPITLDSSDSDSSEITSATSTFRDKRRWKKFLEEFRLEDEISESDSHTVSKRTETPEVVENIHVQNDFGNCDDGEDTSDCDKDADLKFLTPTMFKSDYVEKNPAPVMIFSDNESFNSSITTAPTNSQSDPTFKPSKNVKLVPAKDSPILPAKKRLKTSSNTSPKRKPSNYLLARIADDSGIPKQATLGRFGFASDAANAKNTARRAAESKKKNFRLFDNDIPVTKSSDESSLFQVQTRIKKKNVQPKIVNLGNKRRCEECKKTFKTPTELKKHVFLVHTVEDLSDD